jgi:hypothetical protein
MEEMMDIVFDVPDKTYHRGKYREVGCPWEPLEYEVSAITRCCTERFIGRFREEWKAMLFTEAALIGIENPALLFDFLASSRANHWRKKPTPR